MVPEDRAHGGYRSPVMRCRIHPDHPGRFGHCVVGLDPDHRPSLRNHLSVCGPVVDHPRSVPDNHPRSVMPQDHLVRVRTGGSGVTGTDDVPHPMRDHDRGLVRFPSDVLHRHRTLLVDRGSNGSFGCGSVDRVRSARIVLEDHAPPRPSIRTIRTNRTWSPRP